MTVHFIGAGPGAPDLITVRGRNLIERCPVCLYAGSLVPLEILGWCPPGARRIDTAPLDLDSIAAEFVRAHSRGEDVARLHSGDLSIWSALGEQTRRLEGLGIPYTVTPGVPAFAAAAAALCRELTVPEVAQSVVLTRTAGRASAMPASEGLAMFAATRATLAIHLSIHLIEEVVGELLPEYGADCPAAVVWRASWPDQRIIQGPLGEIAALVRAEKLERTAVILVGRALDPGGFRDSALYSPDYQRRFRPSAAVTTAQPTGRNGVRPARRP
jgi:precorrin-4/cobalt-precorrin-4 C11-methyltransferase